MCLRENLHASRNRMKQYAYRKRTDRKLEVGDMMYLKLQPYHQSSLDIRKQIKLAAKFYGPYQVEAQVGEVAYRLQLPPEAQIYPVFHVYFYLKRKWETILLCNPSYLSTKLKNLLLLPRRFSRQELSAEMGSGYCKD
ncbi:hypothetical protein MANES_08G154011v8 [Manihot esculenta]|uniref:Uncharacterized protein n=1 Tax=Manihot esculenta TaxID=3983 RepID=A0ACB7HC98_MANES|nr:hypothetical protein MANES_08G154011v8 [Manihot esculenta]